MTARAGGLDDPRIRARLIGVLIAIVVSSVVSLGLLAIAAFERAVEPELTNRTRLIGSIVRSDVQRSLEHGIPFREIVGLDRYVTETLEKFDEVDRISVQDASGSTVLEVQSVSGPSLLQRIGLGEEVGVGGVDFSLPILAGNELVGQIVVEVSPHFVETRLRDVFLDVVVIALVATLVALELVLMVAIGSVGKPFDRVHRLLIQQLEGNFVHQVRPGGLAGLGRIAARLNDHAADLSERLAAIPAAARVRLADRIGARIAEGQPVHLRLSDFNDIRLALFLFSVATEIAAAFLPVYARTAARPDWLSANIAAAAPLALYLVAVALLSPFGGALARRFGARRLFLASVPPTALALLAMGLADSVVAISLWRAAIGVFFAIATVACHEYAMRAAGIESSARPAGAFVAVIFGGVFAGSALGGIVADRFGYEAAFFAGAAIALSSGAVGLATMMGRAGDPDPPTQSAARSARVAWRLHPRLLLFLACIVAPMNAATAIFVWYLTPLMLAAAGFGPAEIARVVMLYYLAIVLLGPAVAQLADGRLGPVVPIIVGSVASGLALLSLDLWSGFWSVTAAVAGLGVGHALIRAPQYALALRIVSGSGSLSAVRLIERASALFALLLSAVFLAEIGAEPTIRVLGALVLTGAAACAIFEFSGHSRRALSLQRPG